MAYYSYNPYQPDGNKMNMEQRSQYGYARTESRPVPQRLGKFSNAVTTTQWIGTIFLTAIPLVGLVCLFYWAFTDSTSPSKVNYARALLILTLIFVVIPLIASIIVCYIMWPAVAAKIMPILDQLKGIVKLG